MKWLLKNFVLLHVAAVFFLVSFLGGGTRGEWLRAWAPWMTLAVWQALMIFPQQKKNETLFQARERTWHGLFRDPILYLGLALVGLLTLQALNGPRIQEYAYDLKAWIYLPPPLSGLPGCIAPKEAASIIWWFAPALSCVLAIRHGMLKSGKRMLMEIFCWQACVLSVLGLIQYFRGTQFMFGNLVMPTHAFASFGYPNFAAAYFTFAFILSIGIFVWYQDHSKEEAALMGRLMIIPMIMCLLGAIFSFSRAGVLFAIGGGIIFGIYCVLRGWGRMSRIGKLITTVGLVAFLALSTVMLFSFRNSGVVKEISDTKWDAFFGGRLTGNYQVQCALDMWKDYPMFGVGGWSYRYMAYQYIPEEKWAPLKGTGQANIHNDSVQFLCEHGLVGFGLMLAIFGCLFVPALLSWWKTPQNENVTALKKIPWFYRVNIVYTAIFFATVMLIAHSFFDIPFRAPALMMLFLCSYVLARGYDIKRFVNESLHSLTSS